MNDKELIKALKHCGDPDKATCYGCPARKVCWEKPGRLIDRIAADRLEALLAENERLKAGKDANVPTKRLSVAELQKMNCPVWVKIDMDGVIDGYWCLCNMGNIMAPSGRMFCAKDIPSWEFYRQPPRTEVDNG